MKLCFCITLTLATFVAVASLPLKNDEENSPISKVVIPYAPYTTDVIKDSQGKPHKVYVPLKMDIVPQIKLKEGEIAMGSEKGMALHWSEGAYPVYYMPGNVNGKFQDKRIYLLE